jgi:hypothetical protein
VSVRLGAMHSSLVLALGLGLAGALLGCVPPAVGPGAAPAAAEPPSGAVWREQRRAFAQLRAQYAPARTYTMDVTLELTEPYTGQRVRSRGAVAVSPSSQALRMILLGPGGTTALDLWVCRDRFRLLLPAADLRRRGDASTPASELRGMPVEFLRWWLLHPLDGQLLCALDEPPARRYLVRDGDAVVDVRAGSGPGLELERRSARDRERVEAAGAGCASVRYQQASTGIDIAVRCEKLDPTRTPAAEAFADPDDPTESCTAEQGARP